MTYREKLDELLAECTRSSDAYLQAVSKYGQLNPHADRLYTVWDEAERELASCLDIIKAGKAHPDDSM